MHVQEDNFSNAYLAHYVHTGQSLPETAGRGVVQNVVAGNVWQILLQAFSFTALF